MMKIITRWLQNYFVTKCQIFRRDKEYKQKDLKRTRSTVKIFLRNMTKSLLPLAKAGEILYARTCFARLTKFPEKAYSFLPKIWDCSRNSFVIISISILFIFLAAGVFGTETNAGNQCRSETGGYCLKLPETTVSVTQTPNTGLAQVPGLEFLNLKADAQIGDILAQLYIFGISIVGVSALLVLVFAGVWYMTAGDNQTRVGQAKTWMGNAIFGLVLALISFLILYTINPSLTNTLNLNLDKLKSGGDQPGGNQPGGTTPPGSVDKNGPCTKTPDCKTGLVCFIPLGAGGGVCQ